ncbi:helix-turn-helix domain-containing protein [Nocardia sp. NPDC004068]|uniref:helix-turn-helix domain-containing protein n=1 Tax=Nocardia sp. NPDC004068 TaxID=3364303 RepID=UPI003698B6B2
MVVSTWTKTEVRALRKAALRMTQEQFAEALGFKVETIQKWEQKCTAERPVKGGSAEALDTAYARLEEGQRERFLAELSRVRGGGHAGSGGTTFAVAVPGGTGSLDFDTDTGEVDDEMRRRELGKLAAAATGTAILVRDGQIRLGMADAHRIMAEVEAFRRQDREAGGAALLEPALRHLQAAKEFLDRGAYDNATGKAYASAVGELASITGWLAYDADRHELARRCYAEAMTLGAEADDNDLIAHVCMGAANLAYVLARTGRGGSPYRALQFADRARTLVRGRPPGRIHALIAIREAQAYGLLRDRTAFNRAVATAWRELDQAFQLEPLAEAPKWLHFVRHAEVVDHEARAHADLGDLSKAAELFATAAESPTQTRNATIIRAWSAASRAQLGDTTGALEHGYQALLKLSSISSTRTLRVLEPVRTAVDNVASGAEFRELYDSLARKAAGR